MTCAVVSLSSSPSTFHILKEVIAAVLADASACGTTGRRPRSIDRMAEHRGRPSSAATSHSCTPPVCPQAQYTKLFQHKNSVKLCLHGHMYPMCV